MILSRMRMQIQHGHRGFDGYAKYRMGKYCKVSACDAAAKPHSAAIPFCDTPFAAATANALAKGSHGAKTFDVQV